jgi:hypothetical protein
MGLEGDVVILLDVDGSKWSLEPRHLYVAASRARLCLHVFVKEGVVVPGRGYLISGGQARSTSF